MAGFMLPSALKILFGAATMGAVSATVTLVDQWLSNASYDEATRQIESIAASASRQRVMQIYADHQADMGADVRQAFEDFLANQDGGNR